MHAEQQKNVLVVDDDAEIRGILTTVLQRRGLIVDTAANGHEALALIAERKYAVVLLDLMLPVVDGLGVLATMRDGETPVVLVVTGADRIVTEQLDPKRIHGIVRKPFDPEEVAAIVAACTDIRARMPFQTMAIATTLLASGHFLTLLDRWS